MTNVAMRQVAFIGHGVTMPGQAVHSTRAADSFVHLHPPSHTVSDAHSAVKVLNQQELQTVVELEKKYEMQKAYEEYKGSCSFVEII